MHSRRLARLTNAFSEKIETIARNGAAFFLLQFRSCPSNAHMAADVAKWLWEMKDLVETLEAWEAQRSGSIG